MFPPYYYKANVNFKKKEKKKKTLFNLLEILKDFFLSFLTSKCLYF